MENIKNNKTLVYRSGKSFSEVHTAYLQALKEAQSLGIEEDEVKVMSILETILEIDEESYKETSKKITNKYLESGKDFNTFLEELVSSDIPQSSRPEPDIDEPFPSKIKEDDDEEIDDGSYNNSLKASTKDIDDVIEDDSIDHL
jgi:hypothetical protein